jgi:NitT/TauT family transport system ATP-binding protein
VAPILEIKNLSKDFFVEKQGEGLRQQVLKEVCFEVEEGEFLTIIGPSGCGKSTLLNLIVGLLPACEGSISFKGELLHQKKLEPGFNRTIGYITQSDNLFPWLAVLDNVRYPLALRGVPKDEQLQVASRLIEMVGLGGYEHHYPHELSGGMRKRVSLIRTLSYDPPVILMDEPFGALDAYMRAELHKELLALWERTRKTIIFVTHDLLEAILLADRTLLFGGKPATIKREYGIDIPRPRDVDFPLSSPDFTELYMRVLKDVKQG